MTEALLGSLFVSGLDTLVFFVLVLHYGYERLSVAKVLGGR